MDPAKRAAILHELYADDGNSIGSSYIRVSIGASDMNDHVYSYDDMPEGQTDPDMTKFSLAPDLADVIPVLKEILAINPKIKILGLSMVRTLVDEDERRSKRWRSET